MTSFVGRPARVVGPEVGAPATPSLYDELVSALEPTLRSVAPFILTRLLLRAAIFDRPGMSAADFRRALPVVDAGLRESLSANEHSAVTDRVRRVLERWEGSDPSGPPPR